MGALIRGRALLKFSPFSTCVVRIVCNETVNGNNRTRRCNKARFLQNTLKKTPSSGKSLIRTLFEAGPLLSFSAFRMAYSRLGTYSNDTVIAYAVAETSTSVSERLSR